GVIDGNRCLSWVMQKPGSVPLEFREVIGDRIYGCDDCQDVCPISVRLGPRNSIPLTEDVKAWVSALDLLDETDEWIEDRYGQWYVANRDFDVLRRNALIVVGNVGDPADRRVAATVERYCQHPNPILVEHAAWAADRIESRRTSRSSVIPSAALPATPSATLPATLSDTP
ncbi:MAG: epoxyqueuosine reductase, partial [Ilumatobacter sp.]